MNPESLADWKRSHYGGELRADDEGRSVTVMGWVHTRRDHGGVIFVDLRDRTGLVQVVFHPDSPAAFAVAEELRGEYVVAVQAAASPRARRRR